MKSHIYETIIIGAGVAGIACARELHRNKKDFLVISENIGGRIMLSQSGCTNYGAYFVLSNYRHILPLVTKGERLHPFFVEFHDGKKHLYHLIQMARYPLQFFRLMRLLLKFKSRYERFKKQCEKNDQKSVIESDQYLFELYSHSASQFIKQKGISIIARKFLSEGIYMCTFLPLAQVSAFDFLRLCLGLIVPAYEFTFNSDRATKSFKEKIVIDSVTAVTKKDVYQVHTQKGTVFHARKIVIATPTPQMQSLTNIKKAKSPSNAYVFHVSGKLKAKWVGGQFELFNSSDEVIFIRKQPDGSYIFYSKTAQPQWGTYFEDHQVLFKKHWEPAFNIIGDSLTESHQGYGLFVIGDHNVIGLEDSYITGIYAAHQIVHA